MEYTNYITLPTLVLISKQIQKLEVGPHFHQKCFGPCGIWLSFMSFKSNVETHRSHPDINLEYELCILLKTKLSTAKDHGKCYKKSKLPLFTIFIHC